MLKRVLRFSLSWHALSTALLVVLGACNPLETTSLGFLEVFTIRSEDAACDAVVPGHLQLERVVDAEVTVMSSQELCKSRVVTHELPAGLYSVSWQPNADADEDASGEHWSLRGPSVVSVFPGQVTRLRVRQASPDRELASRVP